MPNRIAYKFLLKKLLDMLPIFFLPDTYVTQTDITDMIFFVFANQKTYYNKKY